HQHPTLLPYTTLFRSGDIPWPETTKPTGRVKFVNRNGGEQLGYMLKLPIKPNPTAALPEKYRRTTKGENGLEFGPPDQILYEGQDRKSTRLNSSHQII